MKESVRLQGDNMSLVHGCGLLKEKEGQTDDIIRRNREKETLYIP